MSSSHERDVFQATRVHLAHSLSSFEHRARIQEVLQSPAAHAGGEPAAAGRAPPPSPPSHGKWSYDATRQVLVRYGTATSLAMREPTGPPLTQP